jgi:preprotein translocase subunit SecY
MDSFMGLVGIAIGSFLVIMILRTIFNKYGISVSSESSNSLKSILTWAAKDGEMRRRVLITVGTLVILRMAFLLPLPGINLEVLRDFLKRISTMQGGSILMLFSSEGMGRLKIFALGLMPFFSSCIIVQLASAVIPRLRALSFGGENGRAIISKYTYIITIVLCIIYSFLISLWLENPVRFAGMRIVSMPGWSFRFICMATMTAAVMLLLFIAEVITRYGIGNGIAVIFVSIIPLRVFSAGKQLMAISQRRESSFYLIPLGIILIGVIYAIFFITNKTKTIEFQDNKSNKIFVHFRPTIIGVIPISFSQSMIFFPATLASFVSHPGFQRFASTLVRGHLLYDIAYVTLIVIFTYIYAAIIYNPKYILNITSKYGYTLIKSKNGKEEDYLDNNMLKVLIITVLFLIALALIHDLAMILFRIPYNIANLIGGIGIVCAVGVFSDIIRQLEFLKNRRESGITDWKICYIAFDEIEAKIKSEYLRSKGILALVEPLRFSWGMPIRTAVDQYRIYVPSEKKEEARNLII